MKGRAASFCPVCGGRMLETMEGVWDTRLGSAGSFRIARCRACGLERTLPGLSEKSHAALYRRYYGGSEGESLYSKMRETFLLSVPYRLWMMLDGDAAFHSLSGRGRLLDVGCNEGRSLAIFRRNGFKADGIEANPRAAATARRRGFPVRCGRVEMFPTDGRRDVAVMANVLEHTADPVRALERVGSALKPGGRLYLSCPNGKSWLRRLFGRRWVNWHAPFHAFHFSEPVLRRMLLDAGFVRVRVGNVTPALWVAQSMIGSVFARRGRPTRQLHNTFLLPFLMLLARGLFFPALWLGNVLGRGDCLVVEARKEV